MVRNTRLQRPLDEEGIMENGVGHGGTRKSAPSGGTWQVVGPRSIIRNAIGGEGIMAAMVREVTVDGEGRGPSLG